MNKTRSILIASVIPFFIYTSTVFADPPGKAGWESRKEHMKNEREWMKHQHEMEKEQRKFYEEMEREERKHLEEMERERNKYEKEMYYR